MGLSRDILVNMQYIMIERTLRRRDVLHKENDIANGLYFIKEGEFEISTKHRTYMGTLTPKVSGSLLKTQEMKISIIGPNSCIGLEDLQKDVETKRTSKVTCVSDRALVYFLNKDVS